MIKSKHSGAKYSAIVGIEEELIQRSIEENKEYLALNRGVNAVENIDIEEIAKEIDFNSNQIQVYPNSVGKKGLRKAICEVFFHEKAKIEQVYITNGGVGALDLIFKTIDIEEVLLPPLYWGAYLNVLKINRTKFDFYQELGQLAENAHSLKGKAVVICDPNNPSGAKLNDEVLLACIKKLDKAGAVTIIDSPYRMLFMDWNTDGFYEKLTDLQNIIISESFSKSIGLSGQRIGFLYCKNEEFMQELRINLLFATNGINNFAQTLVKKILTEEKGINAAKRFKQITTGEIKKNIDYLAKNNLLATEFYDNSTPWGIFVIVNRNYDELLNHHIGSVPLGFFTQLPKEQAKQFSRICVSIPHKKFKQYFDKII
jgi:aspartate aminotransferase